MTSLVQAPTFESHLEAGWEAEALLVDVKRGFGRRPFRMPPRWLYDEQGSELFDAITKLDEYYPTEAERSILEREAASIASITGADTLIELGSGTSDKTHTLIRALRETGQLERFVPFDVSAETLRKAAMSLAEQYPGLKCHGIVGDFTLHLSTLPVDGTPVVAFLGSTIGNLYVEERHAFFSMLADHMPTGSWLLLGVDKVKSLERLVAAYNDSSGVSAEFAKNVLHMLNREMDADFDVESFDYIPFWDARYDRMDLRLRADGDQTVRIPGAGMVVEFGSGEEISIEISTKFRTESITAELIESGFAVAEEWTDESNDVAVLLCQVQ